MDKIKIGSNVETGKQVTIGLQKLLESRLLIQANSGGGKSYLVRKFLEASHGLVQQIVIDIEGEFATLREKFDYLLIGKEGDIPISVRNAELLAKKLLELNVSAIIDLYELKHDERIRFVKLFLDSMINAPKELWHPCIIVIDEAHTFAPEPKAGHAESLQAVKDLATRGRKRGFCAVLATQRLAKLEKDCAAELNNKLIGRCVLDVDRKRAADELGFTEKERQLSLRQLQPGEFYAFGPAISYDVIKIIVDKVVTKHPEAGQRYIKPPAASDKVKALLGKLVDLPKEAEEELRTREDLKHKIVELKRELVAIKRVQPSIKIDPEALKQAEHRGFKTAESVYSKKMKELEIQYQAYIKQLQQQFKVLQSALQQIANTIARVSEMKPVEIKPIEVKIPQVIKREPITQQQQTQPAIRITNETDNDKETTKLRDGAMKMLKATAMFYPNPITKYQIATIAGFSAKGGTFTTYLSELKRLNWIKQNGDGITITEGGLGVAGTVEPLPTDHESLLNMWCSKLKRGTPKMLKEIANIYPASITKEELGYRTGYSAEGGTFNTYLSELRRNGLIEIDGDNIRATNTLFPETVMH